MVVQRGRNTPHRGKWYPADTRFRQVDGPLWEAVITTGVMHQVRVHAASVGLAILGDSRYGGGQLNAGTAPEGVEHILHHCAMRGTVDGFPDLDPPPLEPPGWWEPLMQSV